jgi:hypothetical protein
MWWGGQCPPARFLVPLVPLLGVGVACCVDSGRGMARWAWPLAGLGLALALFMSARPGELLLLNRGDRPTRVWAALDGEAPLGRYLPSLVSMDPAEARVAAVWLGAIAVVLVLEGLARRRDWADRLFRGLGMPLVVLLLVTFVIDRWARGEPGQARSPGPGRGDSLTPRAASGSGAHLAGASGGLGGVRAGTPLLGG